MDTGVRKEDRTGTGTVSVFGYQMRFDLQKGFPALTTKKVYLNSVIHELLWFLKGDTNIQYLVRNNVKIWNEWAYQIYLEENKLLEKYPRYSDEWKAHLEEFVEKMKTDDEFAAKWGELGPIYGKQWVRWQGINGQEINQIQNVLDLIKNDPTSRRILVSGWNVGEIQELIKNHHHAPPPCHTLFHFMVIPQEGKRSKLSCQLYQRSADTFLGVPFNIASYALLTHMIAHVTDLEVGDFIHTFGDVHIYLNHLDQVNEQLSREPRALPTVKINPAKKNLWDITFEDITVEGYDPHPPIKAPIAV